MKNTLGQSAWLALAAVLCSTAQAQTAGPAPIRMLYYERNPYHYTDSSGRLVGLTATPTIEVFARAGIPIKWEAVPLNRVLEMLKRNTEPLCTPGWYKNAEREEYARISVPIYRDKGGAGVVRAGFQFKEGATARELLARHDLRLLAKQNFYYGAYLDELIGKMAPAQIYMTSTDVPSIIKMIHLGRGDMFITTFEEVELHVAQAELQMNDFKVIRFTDVPAVEMRYILCSKQVPASTMEALNAAIVKTVKLSR